MNERITELRQQATFYANKEFEATGKMWTDLFSEKLAKLLVQECIQLCNNQIGNSDYNTGRMHYREDIMDHFGVE